MSTLSPGSESAILSRVIAPGRPDFKPEIAAEMLKFSFSDDDRKRMSDLAAKARQGQLSAEEQNEANNYERVGHFLSILQAKAQLSLKEKVPTSDGP